MLISSSKTQGSCTPSSFLSEACDRNLSVLITDHHSLVRFNQQVISYRNGHLESVGQNPSDWSIIFSWSHLRSLYLFGFRFPSDPLVIPPSISNLTNLRALILLGDGIISSLPSELFSMIQLRYFRTNRMASDQIPLLTKLTKLSHLDISRSHLTGPFPSCLASLTSLVELNLLLCHLTGPIPSQLGQLTNLRRLSLSSNRSLTGSIPSELLQLTKLELISLRYTGLLGVEEFISRLREVAPQLR